MSFGTTSLERWVIIFEDDDVQRPASAVHLLTYFRDFESWLNFFSATLSGDAPEMTLHLDEHKAFRCKVVHVDQCSPRSTYADPFGHKDRFRRP